MNYLTQFLIYVFEICIVIFISFCLMSYLKGESLIGWVNNIRTFDFVDKCTVFFVVYQVLTFAILTLYDSAKKDAVLSKIKVFKLAELREEFSKEYEELELIVDKFHHSSLLLNSEDKIGIKELGAIYSGRIKNQISSQDYLFYLKNTIVNLEHQYNFYDLNWRLSFLLRITK